MPVKSTKNVLIRGKFRVLKRVNTVHSPDYMDELDNYMNVSGIQIDRCGSSNSLNGELRLEKFDPPEGLTGTGRRGAMIAGKNYIEDTAEVTSVQSLDVDSKGNKSETDYKRSSIVLGMQMIPGVETLKEQHNKKTLRRQHTISEINPSTSTFHTEDSRRKGLSFLKLIDKKVRIRESVTDVQEALLNLKKSNFRDSYLASFKEIHWSDLIPHNEIPNENSPKISDIENLRREAVWELFKCELNFLLDHLMVLKHCFMEPLKKLQVDGHLMFVEPDDVFGNLDELCYVSYTFCRDFITTLTREMTPEEFGQTSVLVKTLIRWSQHSRNGDVFHSYCLNYENAMAYLDTLKKNEIFMEFDKWCNKDERLQRLQLNDLLVAPMQHCTKMPLLLSHIRKYTTNPEEQTLLTETLDKTEHYLRSLDDKIMWLRNFERLQEIQSQLVWPSITDMEPRVFIPEFLKHILSRQPCERLIANPKRQLLHEGLIFLNEGNKVVEMYMFLFDDILIMTKIKKLPKKVSNSFTEQPSMGDCDCFCGQKSNSDSSSQLRSPTEGAIFQVYKQPLALDRFSLHDVGNSEALANNIKHAFVLIHVSRFQQVIAVYTIQSSTELSKAVWMDELSQSQQNFQEKLKEKLQNRDFSSPQTNKHSKVLNSMHKPNIDSNAPYYQDSPTTYSENFEWPRSCLTSLPTSGTSGQSTKTTVLSSVDKDSKNSNYHRQGTDYLHHQPPTDLSFLMTTAPFSPPLSPTLHQDFPTLPCGKIENHIERMLGTINDQTDCRGRSYSQPTRSPSENETNSGTRSVSINVTANIGFRGDLIRHHQSNLSRQNSESDESLETVKANEH